jgi:hypothetical protein
MQLQHLDAAATFPFCSLGVRPDVLAASIDYSSLYIGDASPLYIGDASPLYIRSLLNPSSV